MAASPANPQVQGPFTLIYAGNRRGAVNANSYNLASAAIAAAQAVIVPGEKILVMGTMLSVGRAIEVPASLVTA